MYNLPNYSRRLYDSFVLQCLNDSKIKKRDFLNAMKTMPAVAFSKWFATKLQTNKRYNKERRLHYTMCDVTLAHFYSFARSLHFCAINKPESFNNVTLVKYIENNDYVIDFKYKDSEYFVCSMYDISNPVVYKGTSYPYRLTVYSAREDILEANRNDSHVISKSALRYTPLYEILVNIETNTHIVQVPFNNMYIAENLNVITLEADKDDINYDMFLAPYYTDYSGYVNTEIPEPTYVMNIIQHVINCYVNRDTITRKNGKVTKSYNACTVHIAHTDKQDVDKYVMLPLHIYAKSYEDKPKSEYKGGHHASPCSHERSGYFRRSRGHGDYELKDGEFIKVEPGTGHYSFVRPTVVNANKESKGLTIYKV